MRTGTTLYSWPLVIFLLFFFFPVGIPLMVIKVTSEKMKYSENAIVMKIVGVLLIAISLLVLITALTGSLTVEEKGDIWVSVTIVLAFFGGGGLLLVFTAYRFAKKGKRFKRYPAVIASLGGGTVEEIAEKIPATVKESQKDIQQMLDDGWIPGAYLDAKNTLVLPRAVVKENPVTCPNCGAVNAVGKGGAVCEYCRLPL